MAKYVRCPSGHVYDREVASVCPRCGAAVPETIRPADKSDGSNEAASLRASQEPDPKPRMNLVVIGGTALAAVAASVVLYVSIKRPPAITDPKAPQYAADIDILACKKRPAELAACDRAIASGRYDGPALGSLHLLKGYALATASPAPDLQGADAEYSEAIKLAPNDAAGYAQRAQNSISAKSYAASVKDLDQAITLQPKPEYYNARGFARRESGDVPGSLEDFNKAIELNPSQFMPYWNRATAMEMKGDKAAAISDYKLALKQNPDENSKKYIEQGLKALTLESPDDANSDAAYSSCANSSAHGDDAISVCDQAIASGRFGGEALGKLFTARSDMRRDRGQYVAAIADLTEVLRVDGQNVSALTNRANLYRGQGELDRALEDTNAALKIGPPNAGTYWVRGAVYLAKEDFDSAIKDYDQAIALRPTEIMAYKGRGDAYRRKKDNPHAYADYQTALGLSPTPAMKRALDGAIYLVKPAEPAAAQSDSTASKPADTPESKPAASPAAAPMSPPSPAPTPAAPALTLESNAASAPTAAPASSTSGVATKITNADGSSVETLKDGTKIIRMAKGGSLETRPDGTEIVINPDGSSLTTKPDGTTITKTTKGTIVEKRKDGTTITTNAEGTSLTEKPDGSKILIKADGSGFEKTADGKTFDIGKDGSRTAVEAGSSGADGKVLNALTNDKGAPLAPDRPATH